MKLSENLSWKQVMWRAAKGNVPPDRRIEKNNAQWRAELDDELYSVARMKGTERPFSSGVCEGQAAGVYACACCNEVLFDSAKKFESGTGWPSFTRPAADNVINYHLDESHGMIRIEVTCAVCDAHLGHVFDDGGGQTGLRYCINGVCLRRV